MKLVSRHRDDRSVEVSADTQLLPLDAGHNFPARVVLSGRALHIPDWSKIDLPAHQREVQADLKRQLRADVAAVRDGECHRLLGVAVRKTQAFAPRADRAAARPSPTRQ